jgi:hypothetical protein
VPVICKAERPKLADNRTGGFWPKTIIAAVFCVPDSTDADAVGSVACVVKMHRELKRWNEKRIRAGDVALQMKIGITHGLAVLGDIGSDHSMPSAVIGHTVNRREPIACDDTGGGSSDFDLRKGIARALRIP